MNPNRSLILGADSWTMTRMPFLYVEAQEHKPSKLKVVLQVLLTLAVLTFSGLVVLSR